MRTGDDGLWYEKSGGEELAQNKVTHRVEIIW